MDGITGTQAVIAAIVSILSLVGVGKIIELFLTRFWSGRDRRTAAHETNEGKMIDADQLALKILHEDLRELKARVDQLSTDLAAVRDERAQLQAENTILRNTEKLLKERVDKQGKRIEKLETDLEDTKTLLNEAKFAISSRDKELTTLRSELNLTTRDLLDLKRQYTELEAATAVHNSGG